MVRGWKDLVEHLRVVSSAQYWQISSCTMRSISGWRGRPRSFHGVGMRMTGWYTAGRSRRRRPSRPTFRSALRNASWRCIRRRPRSSTARMATHGKIPDLEVRLPWVYLSAEAGEKLQAEQYVLELHPCRQRDGAQEHAANDPGVELSPADSEHTGGHSLQAQSNPPGLDGVLWAVLPLRAVSAVPPRQQDPGGVGNAKVKTLWRSQDKGRFLPGDQNKEEPASLRALAERNDRRVCLMGAV